MSPANSSGQANQRLPKRSKNQLTERKGVAIVESIVTDLGWIFREQTVEDFGVDAHVEIVDDAGQATGSMVGLQIKSGVDYFSELSKTSDAVFYRGKEEHRNYWLGNILPMLIVLHNPESGLVIWQHLSREYLESTGKGCKVAVPLTNLLDESAKNRITDIAKARKVMHRLADTLPPEVAAILDEEHPHYSFLPQFTPTETRINIYPKTPGSPPPSLRLEFHGEEAVKYIRQIETGTSGTLKATLVTSNFVSKVLIPAGSEVTVEVTPNTPDIAFDATLAVKSSLGEASLVTRISCERAGSFETLFVSTTPKPLRLRVEINRGTATVALDFGYDLRNSSLSEALETLNLRRLMVPGGIITVSRRDTGMQVWQWPVSTEMVAPEEGLDEFLTLLRDLLKIQQVLGRPFSIPESGFSSADSRAATEVLSILNEGELQLPDCTIQFPVGKPLALKVVESLDKQDTHNISATQDSFKLKLLGVEFDMGPYAVVIPEPALYGVGREELLLAVSQMEEDGTIAIPLRSKTNSTCTFFEKYLKRKESV